MNEEKLINLLNAHNAETRLSALSDLKKLYDGNSLEKPVKTIYVNNHIHTIYSFSPYSPTKAVYTAYINGLETAGIMDHDSLGGAKEFIEAGKIFGMATTVGIETRANMADTRLNGRKINNPDQNTISYVALHGIPFQNIDMVNGYFAPFRKNRNKRNVLMCGNITDVMKPYNIELDFERDVLPLSMYDDTGSVTERHILYALAKKITSAYDSPSKLLAFLTEEMKLTLSEKSESFILENNPEYYLYDLLGILKAELIDRFYIDAYDECMTIEDFMKIAKASASIAAYPYLGDIGDSVTGDKKAQKFEDDYIELLFTELKMLEFNAVAYMPTRNTKEQLLRVMALCNEYNLFQISGEDINSPRQSFICKALDDDTFRHLIKSTWTLISHEREAAKNESNAMFSQKMIDLYPDISGRIDYFYSLIR